MTPTGCTTDQVMMLVLPWLDKKQVLTCRQVCRQCCHLVDTYLENQPRERTNLQRHLPTSRTKTFTTLKMLNSFLQEMDGHPSSERNPFVGRSLSISYNELSDNDPSAFWKGAEDLLRKFGEHVRYFRLECVANMGTLHFDQTVSDCLANLPNLKGLEVVNYDKNRLEANKIPGFDIVSFTPLPHLESLNVSFPHLASSLVHSLVKSYSTHIGRLQICTQFWCPEYSCYFPALTEIHFEGPIHDNDATDLLLSLQASNLHSLHFEIKVDRKFIIENNIHLWLHRFTQLRQLSLEVTLVNGKPVPQGDLFYNPKTSVILSLKSVTISGAIQDINFDFLFCFPCVEHITLIGDDPPRYFLNGKPYQSYMWEMLPQLRSLTLDYSGAPRLYLSRPSHIGHEFPKLKEVRSREDIRKERTVMVVLIAVLIILLKIFFIVFPDRCTCA